MKLIFNPLTGNFDWINDATAGGLSSLKTYRVPVESPNGTRTTFTIPDAGYEAGSLSVYVNGNLEQYVSEASSTTFTFQTAPESSDSINVSYTIPGGGGGGGSTSPGGSDKQVQFNDATTFGGDAELSWNTSTKALSALGHTALGADAIPDMEIPGISSSGSAVVTSVAETINTLADSASGVGVGTNLILNPDAANSANGIGLAFRVNVDTANDKDMNILAGIVGLVIYSGIANAVAVYGAYAIADVSSGTASQVIGGNFVGQNGLDSRGINVGATGITGGIAYGAYIGEVAGADSNYQLYSDGTASSYFAGSVGIGTSTPTSPLQAVGLPVYADNASAITGGLTEGAFYRTGADPDPVCVVH